MKNQNFKKLVMFEKKIWPLWPILMITGVFLPWLRLRHSYQTVSGVSQYSEEFSGWALAHTNLSNSFNLFSLAPYIFLIFGTFLLIPLIINGVYKKDFRGTAPCIAFSVLCVILAIMSIFHLYNLKLPAGTDYEVEYGIYVTLLSGFMITIDLLRVRKEKREEK